MEKAKSQLVQTPANKKRYSLSELIAQCDPNAPVSQDVCDHQWEQDGQILTSIRIYCPKCGKKEMR